MNIARIRAWPRRLETWALNIINSRDWQLLSDVAPEVGASCEFAHIPKTYASQKGAGTWNGAGFFSYPDGLYVSGPSETYWRKA